MVEVGENIALVSMQGDYRAAGRIAAATAILAVTTILGAAGVLEANIVSVRTIRRIIPVCHDT